MGQDLTPWIMLAAAIAAAAAAIFTWLQARAIKKSTTSSNLINCLNSYVNIMRTRSRALENKSELLCKDYYRELFDLHWTEFQMWRDGLIPDHVMDAWLSVRRRNYKEDFLEFDKDGQKVHVSYQQIWHELEQRKYFEPTDTYCVLMNKAHDEKIADIKKLRKEFKKK